MTSLASIRPILAVEKHPNADLLDIVQCLGFKAIVKRDQWKVGDLCCYIQPDTVLPADQAWTEFYRKKSSRVKAVKLRGVWSQGVVESLVTVGYTGPIEIGRDISADIGVVKYDPPAPQDLNASGPYRFGIPKTDEERAENIDNLPYGEKVDVTLKIDGQSFSAFYRRAGEGQATAETGVGGRSFLYKPESDNHFTRNARKFNVFNRLADFCEANGVSLCVRGEQYGQGIQKGAHNPHSKLPVGLALFSTWNIDQRRYETKGSPLYIHALAPRLGLPTVPMLERDVILTPELIKRYAEELETVSIDGGPPQPFEGVVINHAGGSFKVLSMTYDSRK